MATCNWCGKKGLLLQLSKNKFCYDCEGNVREHIKSRLTQIERTVENISANPEEIEIAINLIDYLESVRHKVPYFKSSTTAHKSALIEMKLKALNKQHSAPSSVDNKVNIKECKPVEVAAAPVVLAAPKQLNNLTSLPKTQCQTLCPHYMYDNVFIAFSKESNVSNVDIGVELQLLAEPDNEFDTGAIMVLHNNQKIGYVPKKHFQQMIRDFWARGECVTAHISGKTDAGLEMKLCFYKAELTYEQLVENSIPCKEFKLIGNTNEDMQDSISVSDVGDEVEFSYDYEKDKVVAISSSDIGFVPNSLKDYVMDLDEYMAFISQIEENDNGKYSVKVAVYEK